MKFNKIGVISALVVVSSLSSQAFAAKNADVKFSARLVAATCDITASQTSINLGTHPIKDVTSTTNPINTENFNLVLNNCTDPAKTTGEGEDAVASFDLLAAGNQLTGNNEMFADANSTQLGIKLSSDTNKLEPNKSVTISSKKFTGAAGTNFTIPVAADLYATTTGDELNPQDINVPVTFSVAYN